MSVVRYLRQLGKESAVYGLSGLVAKIIGVFLIPVYTRVFAPSDYGIIALLSTLLGLLNMFVVLGLDNSAARWYYDSEELSDRRSTIASWFWCQFSVTVAFAGLLFLAASSVSRILLGSSDHAGLVRLAALAFAVSTPAVIVGKWFRYARWPVLAVSYAIGRTIVNVTLTIFLVVVLRRGLHGLYTAQVLAAVLAAVVALVFLRGWISLRLFSRARLIPMLWYGLPLVPAAVAYWIMASSDRFILKMFHDTTEIGLYSIAASLAGGVGLVVGAFSAAWGPFAYSIIADKEAPRVYARVLDVYAFSTCALCTALALFAPLVLRILTTEPYYPAASCVALLAFTAALEGARYIATLGCCIAKKSVPSAVSIGVGAAVNIVLNFVLIPPFGRHGAAIATIVAYASTVVYLFAASQRYYRIPYRWAPSLASLALAGSLVVLDWSLLPVTGIWPWFARLVLLGLFVPLGAALGLIKLAHLKELLGLAPNHRPMVVPNGNPRS